MYHELKEAADLSGNVGSLVKGGAMRTHSHNQIPLSSDTPGFCGRKESSLEVYNQTTK